MPPSCSAASTTRTRWPRRAATRAVSSPAGPAPTTSTSRGRGAGAYQSGSSVSRPLVGSPTHVTIGFRASRTWQVWLQRMQGRMRSGSLAAQLGHQVGIGDLGPRHLHDIGDAVLQRPRGLADVDHRALQDDGHPVRDDLADGTAQLDVEPWRLVEVGPRLLGRVDRAADDDQVVDRRGQLGGDGRRLVRGDPGPRGQLVAGQAQPEHPFGADRPARRGQDVAGEAEAVDAPLVAPLVGQAGQELPDQAVLAGVDLDPVEARRRGGSRRRPEAGHDRGDVLGLHPLRHLAAVDLGHARRRPQRALRVGGRPLATGVAERGDGDRAVGLERGRDPSPPVAAALGQWRPLVGPVALVDAGLLDHDRPAAPEGPAPVVRQVAVREGTVVVAQVRDVRPEEHAVGGRPRAEANGRQEPPDGGRPRHQR